MTALAKGGRTNFFGFVLRLVARIPFLFIAGRMYGAEELGRFASALVLAEFAAMLATMGEKRGLAARLTNGEGPDANVVYDGLLLSLIVSSIFAGFLWLVPGPMFPSGDYSQVDRLVVLAIPAVALTEILLAAQAYKFDIATTVRSRAVVEPWVLSIAAFVLFYYIRDEGLMLSFLASVYAALIVALVAFLKTYGLPRGWDPSPRVMGLIVIRGLPLAGADAIEWGTRRLDLFILGLFAAPSAVGIYYVAQQIASLPQKLKQSFDPVLGPVITKAVKDKDWGRIAKQIRQVAFWIVAAQAGIALTLGLAGDSLMRLVGNDFPFGTGALAFLLAAEVAAALAVTSEAALVYVARVRNLWLSVTTIGLQAALTITFMVIGRQYDMPDGVLAAAAACALFIALVFASLAKGYVLSRILGHSVNNFRWALVYAAAPAVLVGWIFMQLPEWTQLVFGIPAVLGVYAWVVWKRGFTEDDRMLFRKNIAPQIEGE
ncbi:oligosaccharide flippase family protein [Altererythrobacter halimionae]|uniref:Oligosaccharide flippase family protein n=2 Tax=Alteriqipengyuania halimionae TaxID=1926630 RepID=A0A6I4U189_9SPHN|nr:oligosaccharide flippase family protein [Alteriqipengyuania halimionae]